MTSKSPFLVFQNLIEEETCDEIAKMVRVVPLKDDDGTLQSTGRHHAGAEKIVFEKFSPLIDSIESYFGIKYRGTEHLIFQQFPVSNGKISEEPHCENAVFKRKRWIRVKDRDLTGVLWLKNYKDTPPFDIDSDVLGGKLEFPVYNFGFQAQKGTLVVYPACERFISLTSPVLVGELQCIRFHICGDGIWLYDPANFPGDFRTWFNDIV
jgi:hypothetical protein